MKKAHIILIIIGTLFILLGVFHTNVWYDEAYTVGIVNNSFSEIWNITGNDVHPVLYYWMLKVLSIIFGGSILAYRLFSVVAIAIMGILGYTHIRKDFGEKTGLMFSFLAIFLPNMITYVSEIRMYSWAMVFITLTAIYAYRIVKESNIKNWIIFAIFSLASAYTHYYALMTIGLINLALGIYILMKKREKKHIISFLVSGLLQFLLYLPWLVFFISQLKGVSGGFWIKVEFPNTLIDVVNIQYLINGVSDNSKYILFGLAIALYTYVGYLVYRTKKNKEDENSNTPLYAISIYILVILAALIISFKMPILYSRYLIAMSGLLILFLSYFMVKEKRKFVTIAICSVILVLSIVNNVTAIVNNYNPNRLKQIEYVKENIKNDDIMVMAKIDSGGIMAVYFNDIPKYLYSDDTWGVDETEEIFGMKKLSEETLNFLNDYTGRMWLIDTGDAELYHNVFENIEGVNLVEMKKFEQAHSMHVYTIVLIEKNI